MAQDFHDLTGQVIRRVIEVVQEVECSLVDLIRISSTRRKARVKKSNGVHVAGSAPTMAGEGSKASTQDEVDSLLSSLGF